MKTEIGWLRLQLPAGFASRAPRIARLVGEALAARPDLPAGRLAELRVGPLRLDRRAGDGAIAGRIANAIVDSVAGSVAGRPQS